MSGDAQTKRLEELEEQAKTFDRLFSIIADRFEELHAWQCKAAVLLGRLEAFQDRVERLVKINARVDHLSERIDELEESRW